ncbi:MAG: ABC transporter permease [Pirellulaceae bacterium]|nr:ABC transporter permease [Pirellulaceae bacterium]
MTKAIAATSDYFTQIWQMRYFWLSLVIKDLRTRYRGSVIGMGWSLLHPIAMTAVFCLVYTTLFDVSLIEYAPFVLSGMTLWGFFMTVTHEASQTFLISQAYLRQNPAPLAIYPLRTTLCGSFHFLLAMLVLFVYTWVVQGFGNLTAFGYLLSSLVLLFVIGWSMACCCGILNVLFQDTQHLLQVFMQMMFYCSPVFYYPEMVEKRGMGWLVDINPFAACMELIRAPVLRSEAPEIQSVLFAGGFALVLLCTATCLLARYQRRLIFHL